MKTALNQVAFSGFPVMLNIFSDYALLAPLHPFLSKLLFPAWNLEYCSEHTWKYTIKKSHNTCVCTHAKNVAKGLGHYEIMSVLGPILVPGIAMLPLEYTIYFYLIDIGECAIDLVIFFFFSEIFPSMQCLFVYQFHSWFHLIFPTFLFPLSYFLQLFHNGLHLA